jgi:Transcription factor WhiB
VVFSRLLPPAAACVRSLVDGDGRTRPYDRRRHVSFRRGAPRVGPGSTAGAGHIRCRARDESVCSAAVVALDVDTFNGDIRALVRFLEPGWAKDAACREHPELSWFPGRGEPTDPARRVCAGCAVRLECLRYALADETLTGVWGGTSRQQRDRARKRDLDAETMIAGLERGEFLEALGRRR